MKTSPQAFTLMQKAVGFHQNRQAPEAEAAYREVLALEPTHVDALKFLGGLYAQTNRPERAIACFEQALGLDPNNPELLNNLGVALDRQGKLDLAHIHYSRAVQLAPDYLDALSNLGNLLYLSGKLTDAIQYLSRASALDPKNAQTHRTLGHAYRTRNDRPNAIASYRNALELEPGETETLFHLGNLLRAQGQSRQAADIYRRLVTLRPQDVTARVNLGTIHHDLGEAEKAMEHYEAALQIDPKSVDAAISRAGLLLEMDRPEEARAAYDQTLGLRPDQAEAMMGKALASLALGSYTEGWALYEKRFASNQLRSALLFRAKRWSGEDLSGKRLLIWGEQGLGDMLQFIRYAALCKSKGARILVETKPALARLLSQCPFIDEIVSKPDQADYDWQIPVMSLPHSFGTTLETVPQTSPYLFTSEEARQKWSHHFDGVADFKVGLVWAGAPRKNQIDAHVTDRQRSASLELMRPILEAPGCRFFSLQMGEASKERASDGFADRLADPMQAVEDFMDTAAIIQHLDLVISVDTSVAHLAGGLGKPVWILSRFGGCWRWLRNQERSPWYPTARVFGQSAAGGWPEVMKAVADALANR